MTRKFMTLTLPVLLCVSAPLSAQQVVVTYPPDLWPTETPPVTQEVTGPKK